MIALRRQKKLTCRELVELVTEYLEGTLSRRDRTRFDAHLGACTNCTHYVEQFRETVRLTGTLQEDDVSPEAAAALLAQFSEWKREEA
ncbi:MAG: zf-HC2 domain-containing protein [Actinomycetota bacterium]